MDIVSERIREPTHVSGNSRCRLTPRPASPQLSYLGLCEPPLSGAIPSFHGHLLAGKPCLLYMRCCVDPLNRTSAMRVLSRFQTRIPQCDASINATTRRAAGSPPVAT